MIEEVTKMTLFLCEKGKNNRLWYPGFMTADI